jgi:hypothetical protein
MADTTAISPSTSSFRIGDVFNRSFSVFSRHAITFIVITAVAYIPIYIFAFAQLGTTSANFSTSAAILGGLSLIALIICSVVAGGAVLYCVVQDLRSTPFAVGDAVQVALRRLLPMIGVAICVGLLSVLGLILLVVPGLMVICMYYVATPVCIAENEGVFNSMSRSALLTKGHRWQIFGVLILIWIVSAVITGVIELLGSGLGAIPGFILTQVWQVVAGAFGGVVSGVLYYHLRVAKEGVDINQIASVFD